MEFCITGLKFDDEFETFEEKYPDDDYFCDSSSSQSNSYNNQKKRQSSKMLITGKFRNGDSAFGILNSFKPWIYVRFISKKFMPDLLENLVYPTTTTTANADHRHYKSKRLDESLYSNDTKKLEEILKKNKIYYSHIVDSSNCEEETELQNLYGWTSSSADDEKQNHQFAKAKKYKWFKIYFDREYLRRSAVKKLKNAYDFYVLENDAVHYKDRKLVKNEANEENFNILIASEPNIVSPETQFVISRDIQLLGWVRVPKSEIFSSEQYTYKAAYEFECRYDEVEPLNDIIDLPPLTIVSYDIEVVSTLGTFPEASVPGNQVINIGSVVYRYGTDINNRDANVKNYAFHLKNVDVSDRTLETQNKCPVDEFLECDSEEELLVRWRWWLFSVMDVDIVLGYNTSGFDLKYMVDRAKLLGCYANNFNMWSKIRNQECDLKEKSFTSEQKGTRTFVYWSGLFGTFDFDLYVYLMDKYKWRSYSLNNACHELLPKKLLEEIGLKIDVAPRKLWDNYLDDDPITGGRGRYENAVYCGKDCLLPLLITIKCGAIIQFVEMSRLTYTSLEDIQNKGQIAKIINQLSYFCHHNGYALNLPYEEVKAQMKSIPGATVIEPKSGFYRRPVATLDFESLYPSIMIAHNLCFSTVVLDRRELSNPKNDINSFSKIYGETGVYSEEERKQLKVEPNNYFVQHQKGVLPQMLQKLLGARRAVKALMKTETDETTKEVLNVRQLVLKISANSIYGFTVALVNKFVCVYIGETVTAVGRQMIEGSKRYVLQHFPKERLIDFAEVDCRNVRCETMDAFSKPGLVSENLSREKIEIFLKEMQKLSTSSLEIDVIYGDTDSIMILFPFPDNDLGLRRAWDWGPVMADEITKALFKPPIRLAFEKIYRPYALYKKKKYFALKYEGSLQNPKIDVKGLDNVRRDTFLFTSNLMTKIQQCVCFEKDLAKADEILVHHIENVYMAGKVPFDDFIITKKLKALSEYATPENEIHVNVVNKIKKRNPGSEPRSGDRVEYVVIYLSDTSVKIRDKGEDPEYVKQKNLKLDLPYYFNNKVVNAIVNFYYFFDPNIEQRMKTWTDAIHKRMLGVKSIASFYGINRPNANNSDSNGNGCAAALSSQTTTPVVARKSNSNSNNAPVFSMISANYSERKNAIEKTESKKRKARTHITKLGIKKMKK